MKVFCLIFIGIGLLCTVEGIVCPDEFEIVFDGCFNFYKDTIINWDGARLLCQNLGGDYNGDLATFDDCSEYSNFLSYLRANTQFDVPPMWSYWIGGTDRGIEGNWLWVTGEQMDFGPPFWGTVEGAAEPSGGSEQNCASLYRDDRYYIHDTNCTLSAFPLCRADPVSL